MNACLKFRIKNAMVNPIKSVGLNLRKDWGASHAPPPLEKGLRE